MPTTCPRASNANKNGFSQLNLAQNEGKVRLKVFSHEMSMMTVYCFFFFYWNFYFYFYQICNTIVIIVQYRCRYLMIFLDSTKLKIVRIKIRTFFRRRVSIIV